MFDQNKLNVLRDLPMDRSTQGIQKIDFSQYDQMTLMMLRDQITEMLPRERLADMDLEKALVSQFHKANLLQQETMQADDVPANQKAQVAAAVAGTLRELIKMQTELHTAERFKAIEALVLDAMKSLPEAVAVKFVKDYEALAEGAEV